MSLRILIVEDDFSSRKILQRFLSKFGECDVAVDGQEAVSAFQSALTNNEPYQLVCLDIVMPKMDGQQVLQEIRKLEEENGIPLGDQERSVRVIMTTCLEDPKNFMDSVRHGCEGFLPKPVDINRLQKTLQEIGLI